MSTSHSPLSTVLLLFCLPLSGAVAAGLLGLSFPAGLLPVALTTGIGIWLSLRFRPTFQPDSSHNTAPQPIDSLKTSRTAPVQAASAPPAATAQPPQPTANADAAPTASCADTDPKLRHDIRNILSPAMLAAEQLGTSTDPQVLKAARTIDESLDRALIRLKQTQQP
mgnify:CR=1 FL=1|nr:hypothetical protein [uncultured Acetobacter sp.]